MRLEEVRNGSLIERKSAFASTSAVVIRLVLYWNRERALAYLGLGPETGASGS